VTPSPNTRPKAGSMQSWQRIARRVRVPLGFVTAALYLFELWRQAPRPAAIASSLILVIPGLALRAYASGYVKKNRELTQTGPYAYTRNPLYLGSILIAAGFAVALGSWLVAVALAVGFGIIYVPVIASEEAFLRSAFPEFDEYCRRVPRLIPRLTPALPPSETVSATQQTTSAIATASSGRFSLALYLRHREYNALIGAVLLYLSLLFLRPAFMAIHGAAR
jgi:protein-S-isoprenylcysteine O-methyltransferase Ste14